MAKKNNSQKLISTLLANKKLTNAQREKLAALMIRDLDLANTNQDGESNGDSPKSDLPEYRSPKDVMDFLLEYNQDPILKYTCHPIDSPNVIKEIADWCGGTYTVEGHYHLISTSFNQLRDRYKKAGKYLDYKVITLMKVYIDGVSLSKDIHLWSQLQIPYNWHSSDLWTWSKNAPGIVPNPGENIAEELLNEGYKLPKPIISNLTGKKIRNFGDIVMYYKSLFHVKRDDNLRDKVLYIYNHGYQTSEQKAYPWTDRVQLTTNFDNNIELFTSVDKLLQAFVAIIKICIEVQKQYSKELPLIEVGLYKDVVSNRVCFYVHHRNSEYRKSIDAVIKRIGTQQTDLIKYQINGVCDLYIQADFGNGQYAEINLWDGNDRTAKNIPAMEGVKYIMKF